MIVNGLGMGLLCRAIVNIPLSLLLVSFVTTKFMYVIVHGIKC